MSELSSWSSRSSSSSSMFVVVDSCQGKVSSFDSGASRLDVLRKELVGRAHKDHRRKAISVVFWFWLGSTRAVLGVEF